MRDANAYQAYAEQVGRVAEDPGAFAKEKAREAYNLGVELGTTSVGAPLAAHGMEGIKDNLMELYKKGKAKAGEVADEVGDRLDEAREVLGQRLDEVRGGLRDVMRPRAIGEAPGGGGAAAEFEPFEGTRFTQGGDVAETSFGDDSLNRLATGDAFGDHDLAPPDDWMNRDGMDNEFGDDSEFGDHVLQQNPDLLDDPFSGPRQLGGHFEFGGRAGDPAEDPYGDPAGAEAEGGMGTGGEEAGGAVATAGEAAGGEAAAAGGGDAAAAAAAAAAAGETDVAAGGPLDIAGDVAAVAVGLGTLFAGMLGQHKAPAPPPPQRPINPSFAKGVY